MSATTVRSALKTKSHSVAPDAYPGALPDATPAEIVNPVADAPPVADVPAAPNLQDVLNPPSGPMPDPSGIVARQTALFESAIARDKVLSRSATATAIDMGKDIINAFEIERPFTTSSGRKKAWGRMTGSFGRLYEVERSKTARTNEWVKANRVFVLVEPDAQAIIQGDDNEPFDLDTLVALADWIDFDDKAVTWSIRDGFQPELNAMVKRVIEDSLSADKTRQAMKDVERGKETERIATLTGSDKRVAESDLATTRKADRSKKVSGAVETFKRAIKTVKESSGKAMRTPEILVELERAGVIDSAARPIDPATMTPAEAIAFADSLWSSNPAAAYVVREHLNRLASAALSAESKPSTGAAPCLNGTAA